MAGTNLFTAISATCWIALTEEGKTSSSQLAMFAKCVGTPPTTANVFEHGCLITQTDSGTGSNALYQNTGSSASPVWTLIDTALGGPATSLVDANGVTAVAVGTTASAVNQITVTDSATGSAPSIISSGTDAAVGLTIATKGTTGVLTIGGASSTGDIILGKSSGAETVKIGDGAGVSTVNIANTSVAGANLNVATAVTGAGVTDTVSVSTGNAAATGVKVVNILTGTPGTSGNNRLTLGGGATSAVTVNAVGTSYLALNRTTGSAVANAPVATLVNAAGANITVQAGLRILLTLASSLQAGANTLNLNGHGADSIKSHNNPATDIAAAYVTGGIVDLLFNGTVWMDMSQ